MEPYEYQRLSRPEDGSATTRLVRIRSGKPEDEIRVWIQEFPLNNVTGPGAPPWRALSYTWGSLEDTENIIVEVPANGNYEMPSCVMLKSLTVTKHLTEFLRNVRSNQSDYIMWIDAICIDQAEHPVALEERAWQVQMMHQIYSQATGVIVWLGVEANDSDYAIQLLNELGSSFNVDWTTFRLGTSTGQYSEPMKKWAHEYGQRDRRELQAVWSLLGREYFTRTWVRQEAILANDESSTVRCGAQQMQLARFRKAMLFLSTVGFEAQSFHRPSDVDDRLTRALSICEHAYLDEPNLMSRSRMSNCRDARDKVYGNLGIMNITGDARFVASIDVDYSLQNTPEKVFMHFFRRHHERYGTLRLLSEAGLCQGSGTCPSWVPDWRNKQWGLDLSMEAATSHFARAECTFLDDEKLQVLGSRASLVLESQTLSIDDAHEGNVNWYWELLSILRRFGDQLQPNTVAEQISYAIFCALYGLQREIDLILSWKPEIVAYFQYLCSQLAIPASKLELPENLIASDAAWALSQAIRYIKISQLPIISCEHKLMGIGPQGAEPGDTVTAILGSRPLMLLRPTDMDTFQVVGTCVVHGLSWGEALLGILPKNYIIVPQFEPTRSSYVPYYKNTATGETTMWDPRISWADLQAHPPMANFEVVAAPPGQPFRVRPDSEYLEHHDVRLEKLVLV